MSGVVFGTIIDDDDFILFVDFLKVLYGVLKHDGESELLIVARNYKGKV